MAKRRFKKWSSDVVVFFFQLENFSNRFGIDFWEIRANFKGNCWTVCPDIDTLDLPRVGVCCGLPSNQSYTSEEENTASK